jgi:hypothetical protein
VNETQNTMRIIGRERTRETYGTRVVDGSGEHHNEGDRSGRGRERPAARDKPQTALGARDGRRAARMPGESGNLRMLEAGKLTSRGTRLKTSTELCCIWQTPLGASEAWVIAKCHWARGVAVNGGNVGRARNGRTAVCIRVCTAVRGFAKDGSTPYDRCRHGIRLDAPRCGAE